MACRIVQTRLPNNEGERRMFAFLRGLPPDYTLYSELQINTAYHRAVKELQKKTPDFVVVSAQVGVVAIEVKDWNLNDFVYEWKNQYQLMKRETITGRIVTDDIEAPHMQVDAYLHALQGLLQRRMERGRERAPWVSSVLAFPCLTRAEFLNGVQNRQLVEGPQARFYADLERILFKEDLDRHVDHPEKLLMEVVERDARFRKSTERAVYLANNLLVPPKCRIGGDKGLQDARQKMAVLTEQQSRWAFSLGADENFLLDVAGSGKTNALISKAIHMVDAVDHRERPQVLVTTYSRNLEKSLRRILMEKVGDASGAKYDFIHVLSIPALLELILTHGYGSGALDEAPPAAQDEERYVAWLLKEAKEVIRSDPQIFKRFDHIFIDEIQDFSNDFLRVVKQFARGDSYFFVGDVGQKIYRRSYDLERLGLTINRKALEKSFLMYRTPRYIAELATRFVLGDGAMREEFRSHGYDQSFSYPNSLPHAAEVSRVENPEDSAAEFISELLRSAYPGGEHQMLVVGSPTRLQGVRAALERRSVRCQIGEQENVDAVSIVEFRESKGLEREVVVVVGIEDLYHAQSDQALFDGAAERMERDALDRRKVYVALTRPTERLALFYSDRTHPFVREICTLNEEINRKRTEG